MNLVVLGARFLQEREEARQELPQFQVVYYNSDFDILGSDLLGRVGNPPPEVGDLRHPLDGVPVVSTTVYEKFFGREASLSVYDAADAAIKGSIDYTGSSSDRPSVWVTIGFLSVQNVGGTRAQDVRVVMGARTSPATQPLSLVDPSDFNHGTSEAQVTVDLLDMDPGQSFLLPIYVAASASEVGVFYDVVVDDYLVPEEILWRAPGSEEIEANSVRVMKGSPVMLSATIRARG